MTIDELLRKNPALANPLPTLSKCQLDVVEVFRLTCVEMWPTPPWPEMTLEIINTIYPLAFYRLACESSDQAAPFFNWLLQGVSP